MYMADQMTSAEWGASDTVRKGVLVIGWTTGTANGGGVPSRDHIPSVDNTSCTSE
jgi:hypothetical protein